MLPILNARQNLLFGRGIAGHFVRDDHAPHAVQTFERLTEEFPGCLFITSTLYQDREHNAMLINGWPERVLFAINSEKHFSEMPLITGREQS